jgi:hypothetical protein
MRLSKLQELDEDTIKRIDSVQLWTNSRQQEHVDDPKAGSWSWFDVMVLEDASSTEPKVVDGRALVWFSHKNEPYRDNVGRATHADWDGKIFGRTHEILQLLKVRTHTFIWYSVLKLPPSPRT